MLKKERIENNPYRVLGVYAGGPVAVEVSHLGRIRAFSKVGQTASFRLRGDDLLQPVIRTEKAASDAARTLSLARDRAVNALLWFGDGETQWSRVLNDAVEGLLEGDYTRSVNSYETLISDASLRYDFLEAVTHGLLTLSKEELARQISDLLLSCEDDFEAFWLSPGRKPSGRIASILFEKVIPPKIGELIRSIEFYNGIEVEINKLTDSQTKIHCSDFYQSIDRFENTLAEIRPMLENAAAFYGTGSYRYKEIAEALCRKIYSRGTYLTTEIGEFVWDQKYKIESGGQEYSKYCSVLSAISVRACLALMDRVDSIVKDSVGWTRIDNQSAKILYSETDAYETARQIEYSEDFDQTSQIKRLVSIGVWLLFMYIVIHFMLA
ncbi:MAG: hypothetical protein NC336_07035 [Clostridium sp.]|nr:hypothetical protein [Clostridium sp.]